MTLRKAARVALLIVAMACASTGKSQADKSAAIIKDMIAALGGQKFLDVREIQSTYKAFEFKHDQMTATGDFVDYVRFPNKMRSEAGTYRIKPAEIFNGDSGWHVDNGKIEEKSAAEIKDFQSAFRTRFQYVARFVLEKPELNTLYVGSTLIDYRPTDTIEFRDSGDFFRLFIDQQTHLPSKMEVRRAGETYIREEQYANWHEFQSIKTPLYIIRLRDGERQLELRYSNFSYNPGLSDNLFNPPSGNLK
jgi:hypothetical protein